MAADTIMTPRPKGAPDESDPLKDLGHLSDAVAHHVINAFSAVVSNAELIRSQAGAPIDSPILEALASSMIESALEASQVARRLIDWTQQINSIDAGQSGRHAAAVDLNQLLKATCEAQKSEGPERIEWVLRLGPIPAIPGDVAQLRSMLGYLVQNAREALPSGPGTVTFSTQCDPQGWVVLGIRDSGVGMTPEVIRHASEPFFSTKPGHRGIGLTIAQRIWRRHRGSSSIESCPGGGTTIRLSLGPGS
jgi:signal transduction histidine kinase